MFAGTKDKETKGTVRKYCHPLPFRNGELQTTKANYRVIREATKQEFVDYWMEHEPENYLESVDLLGEIPDYLNFYEVEEAD